MSATEEKSIEVLEFSSQRDDWKYWSSNFLARGGKREYQHVLEDTTQIPTKSAFQAANAMSNTSNDEKKLIKTYKLALVAFEDLLLSVESKTKAGRVAFDLVDGCNTNNNPDGHVSLVWKLLIQKYDPKTAPSYIQLKQGFANS